MRQSTLSHQNSLSKENNRNSQNRRTRESTGSNHDDHLISKLIPDFGLSALTRNISEFLDLPERTDLNRGNGVDGSCDMFSSNMIDVVKDLGQEVTKGAQDITVKTAHDISRTAQDISKTAHDISKTARARMPLPSSLVSNQAPAPPVMAAANVFKVKAPKNYNVNFIFTEVERSREEEYLDLTEDDEGNPPVADETDSSIPQDFRTPTKTYEQQDMFNLMYTPATCYSQSSRIEEEEEQEEDDTCTSPTSGSNMSLLNQSIVSSAAKSVHSLESSPLKLEESVVLSEEEEREEEYNNDDGDADEGNDNEIETSSSDIRAGEEAEEFNGQEMNQESGRYSNAATVAATADEVVDNMDMLLQTLFDGEVTPLECGISNSGGGGVSTSSRECEDDESEDSGEQ